MEIRKIRASEVIQKSKDILKGQMGIVIIAVLIVTILTGIGSRIDSTMSTKHEYELQNNQEYLELNENMNVALEKGEYMEYLDMFEESQKYLYKTPMWLVIFIIVNYLVTVPLTYGLASLLMKMNRNQSVELSEIFTKYSKYFKCLFLDIYQIILTILWTLLFIIPGIIAIYKYALTKYIINDEEDLSTAEIVELSTEMMKGHKADLFRLHLSYLGWFILSVFTLGILYVAYVGPRFEASMATFYDEVKKEYEERTGSNGSIAVEEF